MKALIVYAKAGAGHRRAAEAVFGAFKCKGQEKDAAIIDCLDYCPRWFRYIYPQGYIFLVRFLSPIWALIYYGLELRFIYALIRPFRRFGNHLVSRGYVELLKKENPRVVVSTQFFASEIAAALKRKKAINSTLISVVTDFGAHTFWESENVDIFVVASEDTKKDLLSRHIPEAKIKVLGIPIEPPLKEYNKLQLQEEIGIQKDLFTILIVGGGFGVGPIKELSFSLDSLEDKIRNRLQLIVVCSRNEKLHKEMLNVAAQLKITAKILGFVPDLYKMMAVSDVIISKSGGLTTSESLASGLPMIIIAPIPGQEAKNCHFLVKNKAAIRIDRAREVKDVIKELIEMPDRLDRMRRQASFLARANSAEDIVQAANRYMEG